MMRQLTIHAILKSDRAPFVVRRAVGGALLVWWLMGAAVWAAAPQLQPHPFGNRAHTVVQMDRDQPVQSVPAEIQVVSRTWNDDPALMPNLVYMPEKDRLLMLMDCNKNAVVIHSDDRGRTWSPRQTVATANDKGVCVRARGLTYLGQGKLIAVGGNTLWSSPDFGQTWNHAEFAPATRPLTWWDPALVVKDAAGNISRLAYAPCRPTGEPWGTPTNPCGHGFFQTSEDEGRTWTAPREVPQWRGSHEILMLVAKNGDWVAACRTDCAPAVAQLAVGQRRPGKEDFNHHEPVHAAAHLAAFGRRAGTTHWDHYCGLASSVSKDQGRTWSEMQPLYGWGRQHPSMVLLPDGRIVMSYVVRIGYPDTPEGYPQFGVEAVVSRDNGRTWDLPHRYVVARWVGNIQGEHAYHCSVQSTATVLLPDGSLLTAFGTGYRSLPAARKRDVALVHWRLAAD